MRLVISIRFKTLPHQLAPITNRKQFILFTPNPALCSSSEIWFNNIYLHSPQRFQINYRIHCCEFVGVCIGKNLNGVIYIRQDYLGIGEYTVPDQPSYNCIVDKTEGKAYTTDIKNAEVFKHFGENGIRVVSMTGKDKVLWHDWLRTMLETLPPYPGESY